MAPGLEVSVRAPAGARVTMQLDTADLLRTVRRRERPFTARLLVTARLPDGRRLSAVRRVRVTRVSR